MQYLARVGTICVNLRYGIHHTATYNVPTSAKNTYSTHVQRGMFSIMLRQQATQAVCCCYWHTKYSSEKGINDKERTLVFMAMLQSAPSDQVCCIVILLIICDRLHMSACDTCEWPMSAYIDLQSQHLSLLVLYAFVVLQHQKFQQTQLERVF